MLNIRRVIPLLVVLFVLYLQYQRGPTDPVEAPGGESSTEQPRPAERASSSPAAEPIPSIEIDEEHIFDGEINRRGRPVGFHSRPGGRDPEGARLVKVLDTPNGEGVYTARVEIFDPDERQWLDKRSSFFPDHLDRDEVLSLIRRAYADRTLEEGDRWRGPSGSGYQVEGYLLGEKINTAYPLYRR